MGGSNTASTAAEPREVVEAYFEMWNERRYEALPDLVAESFVMHDPAAPADGVAGPEGEVHGREGLRQFIELATTGFPDFEITVGEMVVEDGLVMYEGQHGGSHEGEFLGLPPTHREFTTPHMSTIEVEEGRVQAHRAYFDPGVSEEQLGLTFPTIVRQAPALIYRKLRSSD